MLSPRTDRTVAPVGTVTVGPAYEIHDAGDYNPAIEQHVVDNSVIIETVADGTVIGHGSGFFLAGAGTHGRLIATANHVVPTREEAIEKLQNAQEQAEDPKERELYDKLIDKVRNAKKFVYRVTPSGGDQAGESFVVEVGAKDAASDLARDAASDLAVLKLESPTDYSGLTIAPEGSVQPQDDFWITGLTGGNFPGQTVDAEVIAVDPEVISPELEEALRNNGIVLEDIIVAEALSFGGISGGVGWNAKGEVVGVVSWGSGDNLIVLIKSEKLNELKERFQAMSENSMANESAEDGLSALFGGVEEFDFDMEMEKFLNGESPAEDRFSALFMDVDELPDINDIEGMLEFLADNPPIDPMEILREADAFGVKVEQAQDTDSLLQLLQDTLGPQPDSLSFSLVDWGRDIAIGEAFADLLAGGPGALGRLPGSIGGPIGGIEVEPELEPGVELLFG